MDARNQNYVSLDLAATLEYARNHPDKAAQVLEGFFQRNQLALTDEQLLAMREQAILELNGLVPTPPASVPTT